MELRRVPSRNRVQKKAEHRNTYRAISVLAPTNVSKDIGQMKVEAFSDEVKDLPKVQTGQKRPVLSHHKYNYPLASRVLLPEIKFNDMAGKLLKITEVNHDDILQYKLSSSSSSSNNNNNNNNNALTNFASKFLNTYKQAMVSISDGRLQILSLPKLLEQSRKKKTLHLHNSGDSSKSKGNKDKDTPKRGATTKLFNSNLLSLNSATTQTHSARKLSVVSDLSYQTVSSKNAIKSELNFNNSNNNNQEEEEEEVEEEGNNEEMLDLLEFYASNDVAKTKVKRSTTKVTRTRTNRKKESTPKYPSKKTFNIRKQSSMYFLAPFQSNSLSFSSNNNNNTSENDTLMVNIALSHLSDIDFSNKQNSRDFSVSFYYPLYEETELPSKDFQIVSLNFKGESFEKAQQFVKKLLKAAEATAQFVENMAESTLKTPISKLNSEQLENSENLLRLSIDLWSLVRGFGSQEVFDRVSKLIDFISKVGNLTSNNKQSSNVEEEMDFWKDQLNKIQKKINKRKNMMQKYSEVKKQLQEETPEENNEMKEVSGKRITLMEILRHEVMIEFNKLQ